MIVPKIIIGQDFFIELIYSIAVMVSCLVVYFKTREIYKLTSHKGIKYFRMTFLFLAITFFLRFFSKMLLLGLILTGTRFHPGEFIQLSSLLLLYSGFMTTFYLMYGLSWKRFGKFLPESTDIFHVFAISLSSIILFLHLPVVFILAIVFLLLYMSFVGYMDYVKPKKKKGFPQFYLIYFMLVLFSMLNIVDILIPNFFRMAQFLIYVFSISILLVILYKVFKVLHVESDDKKKQVKNNL